MTAEELETVIEAAKVDNLGIQKQLYEMYEVCLAAETIDENRRASIRDTIRRLSNKK